MNIPYLVIESIIPIYFILGLVLCLYRSEVQSQNFFFGLFLISVSISSLIDDYGDMIENVFLFSPLFLNLYVNKVHQVKTSRYYYLLFLPGIFFYDWSSFLASNDHFNFKPVIVLCFYFISILLLLRTLFEYKRFIQRIKSNFSEIKHPFKWINTIVILSSIWCLYPVIFTLNDLIPFFESEWIISTIFYGQYGVLVYLLFKILFIAIGTNTFSESISFINPAGNSSPDLNNAPQRDNEHEHKSKLFSQMQKDIQEHKLFLDPKLSLFKLSLHLKMETSLVSDLINTITDDNFYSFINKMRIQEFKTLIKDQDYSKFDLESLAGFSGFNSKSTFYRVFKELEGCTPKEFMAKELSQ